MPNYSPYYIRNGWFYHDPGGTDPYTQEEAAGIIAQMQRDQQTLGGGGGSPGINYPDRNNWPTGDVPTYMGGGGDPFGNWWGTDPTGGGSQQGAGSQGWWNTFLGQAGINAGINLLGGYLQDRSNKKTNQANQKAVQDRIRQALAQLDPAQIAVLVKQYLPEMAAISNQQQQTALQQLNVSQARQGLSGTPYGLTAEAGLRGQMANQVSTAAFQRAMETAGQRASAVTGAPFVMQQPNTGLADAFSNTANQIMLARALSQRQPRQSAPFTMRSVPGQATPQPWETQQYEGTPYAWGFNQARGY